MTTSTQLQSYPCHVCNSNDLDVFSGFEKFQRIASDCKPWPPGGTMAICKACGVSQAIIDPAWHAAINQIYGSYDPYFQGAGAEQNVFDAASGAAISRSTRLVRRLHAEAPLAATGRLLDVGCGNGVLLRAFGQTFTGWKMAGLDVHEHLRPVIEGIKGVERFYACPLEEVPGQFRLVSLIHALEHIASPREFLIRLRDKLEPSGMVLIQVPDCEPNPVVLLVADHASHFFLPVLKRLVESAGYEVVTAANNWVAKELTIVARKMAGDIEPRLVADPGSPDAKILRRNLDWLNHMVGQARAISAKKPFGIFGSSIAGSWLYHELGAKADFFVDEDPNRPGNTFFGRPIYAPAAIPPGAHVYLALPPVVAQVVRDRMESLKLNAHFYSPDPIAPI